MAWYESNGNNGGKLEVLTASGDIASFETNLALPYKSVKVNVLATGGNGTPDNPIPINGYTEANITRCGVNILGGEVFADLIVDKVPNAVKDTIAKTITYEGQYILGIPLFDKFKPNTQYTFFIKRASGVANLKINYTDGTETQITAFPHTSTANKTILNLSGEWQSGTSVLNYDECGVFEGVKTVADFEHYNGQTYTIAFGQTVYGGVLDVTRGKLTVTWESVNIPDIEWSYRGDNTFSVILSSDSYKYIETVNALCSCYLYGGTVQGLLAAKEQPDKTFCLYCNPIIPNDRYIYIKDTTYTDATTFINAMTGQSIAYELATPIDIDLTPEVISTIVGTNNVFADCGSSEVEFVNKASDEGIEYLIDPSEFIPDTFIQPSNGTEGGTVGWSATPFIEVVPDEVLNVAAKNNGSYYFSWYDENKTWISAFLLPDFGYVTLTVPSTAHYARFSNQDANMQHLQVWR